jgi:hypothetical protein
VADEPLTCAECRREPRKHENAEDEWRDYLGDDQEMHTSARSVLSGSSGKTRR